MNIPDTPIMDKAIFILEEARQALAEARVSNEVPDRDMQSLIGMTNSVEGITYVLNAIRRRRKEEG